ncbi:conserved hypothetical protein [Aliarcobacter butzleri RM4018]|uniref:Uncharacterized protein n=1 Tax=Aliarcobacter butzleri (strain RM4018) TaxID=367737 RepID=A8EWJ9_ALIB4|nr:hypothetical protein [Aliarcobacter butzleri]ABV68322.1 conserved hypothetical protein [Aliarcobacter butzleri RM4018]GGT79605.1 hypothetical protein GCM10007985_15100 [Aliarcobacter butzleri]SNV33835.1 Uncharacterised protein [Aliarcobacter butzleri]
MNVLIELENFINEFNSNNNEDFSIDSLRIDFSKQHKKEQLEQLGSWKKLQKNSNILHKLKKRLIDEEITSVMRLEKYNIYYYNSNKDKPRYRIATMVIFGLFQYKTDMSKKTNIPQQLVTKILSILKDISNIDLCLDMKQKPNIELLKNHFNLKRFVTKDGVVTDTYYINNPSISMIDKICIYDKALKNKLTGILWRIEVTISIPNIKYLALPLHEFKQITDLAKGN